MDCKADGKFAERRGVAKTIARGKGREKVRGEKERETRERITRRSGK